MHSLWPPTWASAARLWLVHVPYRGEVLALNDIISQQIEVLFVAGSISNQHVKGGTVRSLGTTAAAGSAALPEMPTISETVPGYDSFGWAGIAAPRGTAREIIDLLNREVNAALASAGIKARYEELGITTIPGSSTDFAKLIANETETWGAVIRATNIKME
jgi:tripartite-type tricarboxylate transporter receptor subunit TctC